MRTWLTTLIVIGTLPLVASQAPAQQEAAAGRPTAYKVRLKFHIDASRQQRYERYQELLKHLQAAGFKKDKGLDGEEFYSDTMTGVIPASGVDQIFHDRAVRTVLLVPEGFTLPTEAESPVVVELLLTTQFGAARQQYLAYKTRDLLKPLKFQEAVGYDTRNHQRLLGWLPAGSLDALFQDSFQVDKAPPVRRIEVFADTEAAKAPAAAEAVPADKPYLQKITADLRQLIAGQADSQKPIRVEVILWTTPKPDDPAWFSTVTGSMEAEGRIGPLISGLILPGQVEGLAALPEVAVVRLPQPARSWVLPAFDSKQSGNLPVDFVPLGRSVIETRPLPEIVRRHAPQRVAVVANDFNGYQALVGKQLPAKTVLIDFTAERNSDLQPDPPAPGNDLGSGVRFAAALHATVPADELVLVRIPADGSYQLRQIAMVLQGKQWLTDALLRRDHELQTERKRLNDERLELRIRRRLALESFSEDATTRKARQEYLEAQKAFDESEKALAVKSSRMLHFLEQMRELRGVSTVLVAMAWTDGYPNLPGQPPYLRYLNPDMLQDVAWLEALPRRQGQVWTGVFRDADNDGVMEFAPGGTAGGTDVNFLGWQTRTGDGPAQKPAAELPANAVVQIALQWQEVQSPDWKRSASEDAYRQPLAPLQIVVLRQRDPTGQRVPADLFDVVERSTGWPERLESDSRSAIYLRTVRFQVPDQPGRYAVRIEGHAPDSVLPADAAKLPQTPKAEVHPKLVVEVVDPATRQKGRAVLRSFATGE